MNIVSPFGRLSRRDYLAVAGPLFITLTAVGWATGRFVPPIGDSIGDFVGTPWFRWLLIAGLITIAGQWGLFCAAVKRLHDFRWTGALALPLLWSWLQVALSLVLPVAVTYWRLPWDLPQLLSGLYELGFGLRFYGWALLIVLAIVPGDKPRHQMPDDDTI